MFSKTAVILLSFALLFAREASADPAEIGRLEAERGRLEATRDSLLSQRARLAAEADRLSARIDSLKSRSGKVVVSAELQEALRRSLRLAGRLEEVDQSLEEVRAGLDGVRERLRTAYDREIEELTRRLGQGRDEALARQLITYRKAREALGREAVSGQTGPGAEDLYIREDDGPDEIRQKADLMEDMAARLRVEAAEMERRLQQLETERRLRARATAFAREIELFDEHLSEGRRLSPAEPKAGAGPPPPAEGGAPGVARAPGVEAIGAASERAPVAGKEVVRGESRTPPEELSTEGVVSEIQELKVRKRKIQEREQALRERVDVFRERLRRMLEERD